MKQISQMENYAEETEIMADIQDCMKNETKNTMLSGNATPVLPNREVIPKDTQTASAARTVEMQTTAFTVNFASVPICIYALFDSTRVYCEEYLTTEAPAFEISIDVSDIEYERRINAAQMAENGHSQASFTDAYMERLALLRKVSDRLVFHNVLLFHGCAVAVDGKAYLFTARSGTGKTTHCKLWEENIPGCHILIGDKPFLLFRDEEFFCAVRRGAAKNTTAEMRFCLPVVSVFWNGVPKTILSVFPLKKLFRPS